MKVFDIIPSADDGEIVATLARQAGIGRSEAEQVVQSVLPELGRAIQRSGEGGAGAEAVQTAMQDERYAGYLDDPAALEKPGAAADGEGVLAEAMNAGERDQLVRRAAAATGSSEDAIRTMLPLVATLAMAALGLQLRAPSPEIPWFGTRPGDHFDAPLLNALAAMFEYDEEPPKKR
jgi:hypothetical protein